MTEHSPVVNLGRISRYEASPFWSMAPKWRVNGIKEKTPGPLTYSLPAPHLFAYSMSPRQVTFSKAARVQRKRNIRMPAPGAYNVPSAFESANQTGVSLKGRWKEPKLSITLGPGAYNVNTYRQRPISGGYMGRVQRPLKDSKSLLGPGSYNIEAPELTPKHKAVFSFSRAERTVDTKALDLPAPGAYDVTGKNEEDAKKSRGISFKGNRIERRKSVNSSLGVVFSSFAPPRHAVKTA